jgi:serine/threonine-protein kinase
MAYGLVALGAAVASLGLVKAYRARDATPARPGLDQPPGESLGAYRLLEKIGEGGSADVFRARSINDPSAPPVALKLQREKEKVDHQATARFQLEIQASLKLKHPNLAEVHDWGEDSHGRCFMVSELLEGETLRQRLRRGPSVSLAEIATILRPLGEVLAYLHEQMMVHRDVKPDNIFLTGQGKVKLMDLGIIKSLEAAAMTRAGVVVGTPHYLSPEQIQGESAPSSDQYGLGVTIFEMLCDNRPFRGTPMEIIEQHLYRAPPRLSKFRRGCPIELDVAVGRMLAKEPEQRFPGVMEAVEAVCAALAEGEDGDEDVDTMVVVLT